jgi:hypothetical protein
MPRGETSHPTDPQSRIGAEVSEVRRMVGIPFEPFASGRVVTDTPGWSHRSDEAVSPFRSSVQTTATSDTRDHRRDTLALRRSGTTHCQLLQMRIAQLVRGDDPSSLDEGLSARSRSVARTVEP